MRKRNYQREKRPLGAMRDREIETAPSFTRILHKHGLCPSDMPASNAFDLFTRVGSDVVVQAMKPRTVVPKTNQLGIYAPTAAALDKMTAAQKKALLQRLEDHFRLEPQNEGAREYR
jgi:hypothetical protein